VTDYISELAQAIREQVPEQLRPTGREDLQLFRVYAVLARAKGCDVSPEDVHDAWCAWMAGQDPLHAALIPYHQLNVQQRQQDEPFVTAIVAAADSLKLSR
jgi:hypothetical protein